MENTAKVPAVIQAALIAQNIDTTKCNLMLPTETYGEVLGMFNKITFESIKVNPDPAGKEVYEPDGPGKGKALGKIPLQKISLAMGVIWDPVTTGTVEDTDTKSRAKATGAIRKPNGEPVIISDEKTIDVMALTDRDRLNIEEKAEKGNPDEIDQWHTSSSGKKYPTFKPWNDEAQKKAWIERAARKASIQHRLSKNEKANTGAKERVIRALIAMKSTYTDEELSKPFVYPCVSIDSAKMLATPELQASAIRNMGPSLTAIFGDRNVIDVSPAKPIPHTVDTQTQEVLPTQESVDDFELEAEPAKPAEKTPLQKLREMLEGYREKVKGSAKATKLLDDTLAKEDATAEELNGVIDRFEAHLQKQKAQASA